MTKLSVDQALSKAKSYAKKGEVEKAQKMYQMVLKAFPKNKRAQKGLAALSTVQKAISSQGPTKETIAELINLYTEGKLSAVTLQARTLIKKYPEEFIIWNILGAANNGLNKIVDASKAFKKVTELNPTYADGFNNLGVTIQSQGKLDEAIACFTKALSLKPDYANAHYNIGNAFQEQGKLQEAIVSYEKALFLKPDYANAHYNMGNAFQEQGKFQEAIASYEKALSLRPDYADAFNNRGNALQNQGKLDEAIESYEKALSLRPDYTDAFNNRGNALQNQGKLDEAIASYEKALSLKPDYADVYYNIGNTLQEQGKLDEAIVSYEKALLSKPDYAMARAQKLHQQAHICDWSGISSDTKYIAELGITGKSVQPFAFLSLEDAPERHLLRSKNFAREKFRQKSLPLPATPSKKPKKLRIGYFSADFHTFPGMHLMAGMLEKHDRKKFEIYAFSYGPEKIDEMRRRIINAVDHFIDIEKTPIDLVREIVIAKKIDVAIHRNGYTSNSRTELFSNRLAPIQINYLGYPGTLGADFIDYIVADHIIIPKNKRSFYSEKIIYLPHTYQPNDNKRMISNRNMTRKEMGLPNNGFVFCCFNNSHKISSVEFDIWMRLLSEIGGSVLWLLKVNQWAEQNLKREAEARGIRSHRLIFAEKLPQKEHLARHRLADLFLDTFSYNAHTTASDALWAGLPVITKQGQGFPARVAGSLLRAVELPELITESEEAYEALALDLAKHPKLLTQIKAKLEANRLTKPLFDTEQYTRHLEVGYQMAYDRYFNKQSADDIIVLK